MDSSWAYTHRARLTWILLIIGVVLLSIYLLIQLYQPPTCFDRKKNQDEVGADCGGSCALLCASQTDSTKLLWSRAFEVSPGTWNVVAYSNNPNFNAYAPYAPYRFEIYDRSGNFLGEHTGVTFITSEPALPVFASKLQVAGEPYRVMFEWDDDFSWYSKKRAYQLTIEERKIQPSTLGAEVTAILHNKEPIPIRDVEVTLVVYGNNKNAIAVSNTYIDVIEPRSTKKLTFSWPTPFIATPERLEFLSRIPEHKQ